MRPTQTLVILGMIAAFGVLVPYYKGFDFLDPRLIVAYACLSAVVAAASIADAFARASGPMPAGEARRTMLRVWLSSWGLGLLLLFLALATVNLKTWRANEWHVSWLLPRPTMFLIACIAISATLPAAVVAAGSFLTRRFSAAVTKGVFRGVFLVAIMSLFFADRSGVATPDTSSMTSMLLVATGVCFVLALALAASYPRK